jgi:hypothetical protein
MSTAVEIMPTREYIEFIKEWLEERGIAETV